jgi:hypothetical protein
LKRIHENSQRKLNEIKKIIVTKEDFLKSNYFKIMLPVLGLAIVIGLWQNGYEFGQWLYRVLHSK